MKISRNWLSEYVSLGDRPAAELAETLTMGGLEVDAVEQSGPPLDGVVVGRVDQVRAHPDADRLVLCDVALAEGEAGEAPGGAVQIACGAPNVAAGQHVPVATVGTRLLLPQDGERTPITIEAVELRGERSEGMICSAHELDIGSDASGILVLDDDAPVGQPLADYLAARGAAPSDAVLNIDLTPNRPDAASHLGVARDFAALTDARYERPAVTLPEAGGATAEALSVDIEDPAACPRYTGLLVRGVTVQESPAWLKARLTAVGLRPRNAVVDVTNFVMYECGQPLHAFDFSNIRGGRIAVRTAAEETPFTTLDGIERAVPAGTLLVCDAERPVALAGLMGGACSEVTNETTDVLLESAYFDASTIRRAAKALGLATDASYRFERGVDRDGQVWAAARAARLIAEITGGTVASGHVDAHPAPPEPVEVALRPARANALLGTELSVAEMTDHLDAVGVRARREDALDAVAERALEGRGLQPEEDDVVLHCTVPTFRPDLTREVDLIEEIARLHGYDQIPAPAHVPLPARPPREAPARRLRRGVRGLLAGLGVREIQTNSMLPRDEAARFLSGSGGAPVETLKPISEAMAALRPRLLPGALEAMRFNQNRGQRTLRFFEFGRVFRRQAQGNGPVPGYDEREALLVALGGRVQPAHWSDEARAADFYDLKGLVERLLEHLRLEVAMEPFGHGQDPNFDYGLRLSAAAAAAAEADAEAPSLGVIGKVMAGTADAFDLEHDVFAAELGWEALAAAAPRPEEQRYQPPPAFPAVERDLAVVVAEAVPAAAVLHTIERSGPGLLQDVHLFDRYAGQGVAQDKKSLAFALRFQAAGRTLEDEEVDAAVQRIVSSLEDEHDAQLRQ